MPEFTLSRVEGHPLRGSFATGTPLLRACAQGRRRPPALPCEAWAIPILRKKLTIMASSAARGYLKVAMMVMIGRVMSKMETMIIIMIVRC